MTRPGSPAVVAVALALAAAAPARAQGVDVDDLPPLPPPRPSDTAGDVAVIAAAAVEEDVVVGAAKREQSLGDVASAVTVITGERLRRFGYRTVAEAIRGVAGVFVVDDHMTDRVGIRGLQVLGDFNTRILVLVDGATVNEPWGQFAGVGWDAAVAIDDVARIELIRGPVSSVYGTNAFFGIVNIVTRGADQTPRAWGRLAGTSFAGGAAAAGFAVGGVDRQLRGTVAGVVRGGETLEAPSLGETDADGIDGVVASLVGAYDGAFAQARVYTRRRELTFAPYGTRLDDRNRNLDSQALLEGGYTRAVSDTVTLTGRAYASRYRFRDYLVYEPDDANFEDIGDATWAGVEVRGRWDVLDRRRLGVTAGAEATLIRTESRSYFEGDEAGGTVVPKDFDVEGVYAEVDGAPLPWLAFAGGVRFDRNSVLEDRVSPRAALLLARGDAYGLKLLYAEGFRNPSPFEGFFEDGTAFVANPAIGAETIRSYEVVLWGRPAPGVSTRVSTFRWEADDIVEQVFDEAAMRLQFQNVGALTSTGVEVEGSYRDARGWLAFVGGSAQRVEDGAGDAVPGAPAVAGSLGVSTPRLADRVHASTDVVVIGPRPTRGRGARTDAFVGWNAALYAPDLGGFDVTIGVRNLLGVREQVPAQEDFDRTDDVGGTIIVPVLPGEGREFHARIGFRFQ